jgi:hypothetical protein
LDGRPNPILRRNEPIISEGKHNNSRKQKKIYGRKKKLKTIILTKKLVSRPWFKY